jgi:hypothetical protein
MIGATNSGKGMYTFGLEQAFDEYITTFNTSVLLHGKNANLEDASKWRFLMKCHDSRVMIGNEIAIEAESSTNQYGKQRKKDIPLNIDMIKTLVSGGDKVEARRMCENEITISNHAFLIVLVNDLPHTPGDTAYAGRQIIMYGDRSSTEDSEFDSATHFKADTGIKDWLKQADVKDAYVKLVCHYYKKHKFNKTAKPDWVCQAVSENVNSSTSWDWVCENYDVYNGDVLANFGGEKAENGKYKFNTELLGDYWFRFDWLFQNYKDGGGKESITKFGKTLTSNGVFASQKKVDSINRMVRVGLKRPQKECVIESEEEEDEL